MFRDLRQPTSLITRVRQSPPLLLWLAALLSCTVTTANPYATRITVAQDGSGDFSSIQQAIYHSRSFPPKPIVIAINNGIYHEKVEVFSWNTQVSLQGESRTGTIIRYDDHFNKMNKGRNSTFHTYTLKVSGNDFSAQNLTIENTAGPVGQAVALHVEADRASFSNVSIKGFQDTLYLAGEGHRSYFKDCLIEGSIDFIFGGATAVFENCEIRSVKNGYITAASTPTSAEYGFVFKQCQLTAASGVANVYLGRPWRPYAKTVFIDSEMGTHIHPAGWHNWNDSHNEKNSFFAEYGSFGDGLGSPGLRAPWAKQLTDKDLKDFSTRTILRGWRP